MNDERVCERVSDAVGGTPMVRLRRSVFGAVPGFRGEVFAKLEFLNPTGERQGPDRAPHGAQGVRAALGAGAAEVFRAGPRGRPHLDLRAANRRQLLEAGLSAWNVHAIEDCTACRPDLYHAYRRDGSAAGRMLSYIGFVAP